MPSFWPTKPLSMHKSTKKMHRIKAGVVGAAGFTGGETLRVLLGHPAVDIAFAYSRSNAGRPVHEAHPDLLGDTSLVFSHGTDATADVVFLCLGHGESKSFLADNPFPGHVKIIDLSQDFRLQPGNTLGGRTFVYGLPELNREAIVGAGNVANPGCFATCLQLALLPLAKAGLLQAEIHISATTGSTGAGQKLQQTTGFTWRTGNLSVYKPFTHQHLGEIGQSLRQLQPGFSQGISFIPYRGNFTRGIFASVYFDFPLGENEAVQLFEKYYESHPFTCPTGRPFDLKQVVNTNKCFVHVEKHGGKLLVTSAIDNLLKGAVGQAVQNMNLMAGFEETLGLKLKAAAF